MWVPAVASLCMNLCMTCAAKAHQIPLAMVAAFGQRFYVVYLLGLCIPTFLEAELTERVGIHVPVSDAFPRTSIPALGSRIAFILFIASVFLLFMFRTEASIREVGTAWVGAGALWFSWHQLHLRFWHKKSPADFHCKAFRDFILSSLIIS